MKIVRSMMLVGAIAILSACGSDSDDSDETFPLSSLQFFNASANSASTSLLVDDVSVGSSVFGDATSLVSVEEGDYDLTLRWIDTTGQEQEISTQNLNLADGDKTLVVMSGNFDAPTVTNIDFERSDLEEGFTLRAFSAIQDVTYDLYIGEVGAPFSEANLITDLAFNSIEELPFFDAGDDPLIWDSQEYKVFLTETGTTNVLYESDDINFSLLIDYIMIVRSTTGPGDDGLAVDIVTNSTSVQSFNNLLASAQFRVYNSLDFESNVLANIRDNDGQVAQVQVSSSQLTGFSTLPFGDYQVNILQESDEAILFENGLLTLNQDQGRTLVIYRNELDQVRTLNFDVSDLPQSFSHDLNIVNLVPGVDDLILYFVRAEETLETAEFQTLNLDFSAVRQETVPSDFYQLILISEDDNGNEELLFISDFVGIDEDTNYLITIEGDVDEASGISVNLLNSN
jgi:hypothetical protein